MPSFLALSSHDILGLAFGLLDDLGFLGGISLKIFLPFPPKRLQSSFEQFSQPDDEEDFTDGTFMMGTWNLTD